MTPDSSPAATAKTDAGARRARGVRYPAPGLLGRLGEPYLSLRDQEHEHLGLGIFIAQTLLERTGAELTFVNGLDGALVGAAVTIVWPRAALAL